VAEPSEDTVTVERNERFGVAPDVLWDAITDPDLLAEWFGPVEFDLTPGGAITDPETIGVVETLEPAQRIGFVWIAPGTDTPSAVELVIEDDGEGGSILHVREALIVPHWETRPAWFGSAPRASAGARA
jgi:uncharacterized protein YndB with AHSA1/START domain